MAGSHGDGESSYYEALGLTPEASAEEVRDAFRLYVRLLHPDQHTDPELKQAAEAQMRKLNRIHAVLSDPDRRRFYDATLDSPPTTVVFNAPSDTFERLKPKLAWVGAIVLSAALLIWLSAESQPGLPVHQTDSGAQAAVITPTSAPVPEVQPSKRGRDRNSSSTELAEMRVRLQSAISQRDTALQELNRLRNAQQSQIPGPQPAPPPQITETKSPFTNVDAVSPQPRPPAVAASVVRQPSSILDGPARPERPAAVNNAKQLAGSWFYVKPTAGQSNKNHALYPPEYIEATIVEEAGIVHGKLRAKFEIVDRAISPDVNFTFTGSQSGMQASGPWIGAGGSKGEVTMKLTSDNSMRIDWTASDLGTQMGLSSGTAVLTRRIE